MKLLLAGCGDIAHRVAALIGTEAECMGLRRNADRIGAGITAYSADLCHPASLQSLPKAADHVLVTLTPSGRTEQDYERAYVQASHHLRAFISTWSQPPKRVWYVSSTSVYGQQDHSVVDETSPTQHSGTAGQLVQAEQCWLQGEIPATVLRLSGIYGDQRQYFLKQVIAGCQAQAGTHVSNRIHIDDAARAIVHLIKRVEAGQPVDSCYIVSDTAPTPLSEVVSWVRQQWPQPIPESDQYFKRRGGSKYCSSERLQQTGFEFTYPSYQQGYRAMMQTLLQASE